MPTATFSLPALPTFILMVFISLLATHSLLVFPSSTCSLDIFQCPRTRRQVSLKQLQQRGKDTEREAVLFPHRRSLCGCQPPVGALGMVCMCCASGGARHTSGKEWGGRWGAWNNEVKSWHWGVRGWNPTQFSLKNLNTLQMLLPLKFLSAVSQSGFSRIRQL